MKTIEELRREEEEAMEEWDLAIAEKNAANEKIKICRDRYEKARLAWIKERDRQDTKKDQQSVDTYKIKFHNKATINTTNE